MCSDHFTECFQPLSVVSGNEDEKMLQPDAPFLKQSDIPKPKMLVITERARVSIS